MKYSREEIFYRYLYFFILTLLLTAILTQTGWSFFAVRLDEDVLAERVIVFSDQFQARVEERNTMHDLREMTFSKPVGSQVFHESFNNSSLDIEAWTPSNSRYTSGSGYISTGVATFLSLDLHLSVVNRVIHLELEACDVGQLEMHFSNHGFYLANKSEGKSGWESRYFFAKPNNSNDFREGYMALDVSCPAITAYHIGETLEVYVDGVLVGSVSISSQEAYAEHPFMLRITSGMQLDSVTIFENAP